MYSGFRRILYDGAISGRAQASGTIIAGCSAATTLAKLALLGPLTRAVSCRPQLQVRNVVDDVSLQAFGPCAVVSDQLPTAVESLFQSFRELELPVHLKKCKFLASSPELATMLNASRTLPPVEPG